ncbi:metalloregulator ArsR/SmtB family transcription factor [uncultured Nocardioides sp.]|uniref:ArsR/SmtB family transcription factor n=1 Tax=uncultured Nocardioides sp. TaxID=198441 RepID=UPI0026347AA0|nr:metalloregulator ArsR/SmtB family transcription factor [uncultured Nocardioides sp.]
MTGAARVCAALGDETRWRILELLGVAPASASGLADRLPISRQGVTQHLEVLRDVGLVTSRRDGRQVLYTVLGAELAALGRRLEEAGTAWDRSLAALKRAAEAPSEAGHRDG